MTEVFFYQLQPQDVQFADAQMPALLNAGERARVGRFRHEQSRQCALLSRAWLRRLLAQRLGCAPLDLTIASGEHGKPFLPGQRWHFNVSHSRDVILIALNEASPVGVDVEQVRPRGSMDELAQTVMHPAELAEFQACDGEARVAYFFKTWVLKEAWVKYDGRGIQAGLKRVQTDVRQPAIVTDPAAQAAFVAVPPGLHAAVVSGAPWASAACRCEIQPAGLQRLADA